MPDLAKTLNGMFSGGDMTIFQATIDAVGEGVLTVHFNGGSFTDVPYIESGFTGGPQIDDPCYVIGQKNWGLLVLGKPAPGPTRLTGDTQIIEWSPSTIGIYNMTPATWTTPTTDEMAIQPGPTNPSSAVYFYDLADNDWNGEALATASFFLEISDVDTGGEAVDNAYIVLGLHTTPAPGDTYQEAATLFAVYAVSATAPSSRYVSIPLDWATRLLSGQAEGIFVRTDSYPLTVSGPGTIRLTTL